jgi:hypothetical protein
MWILSHGLHVFYLQVLLLILFIFGRKRTRLAVIFFLNQWHLRSLPEVPLDDNLSFSQAAVFLDLTNPTADLIDEPVKAMSAVHPHNMRTPTLQPVPESLPADHVSTTTTSSASAPSSSKKKVRSAFYWHELTAVEPLSPPPSPNVFACWTCVVLTKRVKIIFRFLR